MYPPKKIITISSTIYLPDNVNMVQLFQQRDFSYCRTWDAVRFTKEKNSNCYSVV